MKYTDLKDKDLAELNSMLKQSKLLLFTARQKLKTMQLSNPNEISAVRKEIAQDIARINTAIKAK
ncbi:50S ribosomal protein L29 [uncultured Campylobacter sp.]|uniref:50S ribosomal protein L29 n=1 Tax=uncultured Campylobacter sp. TaxID=218934 RepID=UPI00261CC7FE|nr:50S ribosomal protein L29 [uncultured Campylobacter sp.]